MRLLSIDVFRALTMLLMIWVNDFWTLTNIPKWLEHASPTEDYLGFSDIIFPLFLFIVGLSIPFAIEARIKKGENLASVLKHIFIRTASLLLIGFFMVNYENAHDESIIIGKYFWCILMAIAVFFIWMGKKDSPINFKWNRLLWFIGFIILFFLAIVYKGGANGDQWMKIHWWGILGLIGWAYFINSLLYIISRNKYQIIFWILIWLLFISLSIINTQFDLKFSTITTIFSVIFKGTIPAFTAAGIITSILIGKAKQSNYKNYYIILSLLGFLTIIFGFITRPIWGISKIRATPSWLMICTGIGFLGFILLHYYIDIKKYKIKWYKIIAPAGTATFTCYMIPYIVYPLRTITGWHLPKILNDSTIGLLSSFIFALMVVLLPVG